MMLASKLDRVLVLAASFCLISCQAMADSTATDSSWSRRFRQLPVEQLSTLQIKLTYIGSQDRPVYPRFVTSGPAPDFQLFWAGKELRRRYANDVLGAEIQQYSCYEIRSASEIGQLAQNMLSAIWPVNNQPGKVSAVSMTIGYWQAGLPETKEFFLSRAEMRTVSGVLRAALSDSAEIRNLRRFLLEQEMY